MGLAATGSGTGPGFARAGVGLRAAAATARAAPAAATSCAVAAPTAAPAAGAPAASCAAAARPHGPALARGRIAGTAGYDLLGSVVRHTAGARRDDGRCPNHPKHPDQGRSLHERPSCYLHFKST